MSLWKWVKGKLGGDPAPSAGGAGNEDSDGADPSSESERAARRELDRAIASLSKKLSALPDGPEKIGTYFERGVAYKKRAILFDVAADLDRALDDLARVSEVVPALPDVYAHRGECFLRRSDHERAIDSLDRAIALLPTGIGLAVTHLNRGKAHAAVGDTEAALADFDKAAQVAPETAEAAREGRALVRPASARGDEDFGEGATSRKRARRSAGSLCEEGWQRDAEGDPVGALVAFGEAIEREPSPGAYYGRGVVNCKLRRHSEAIADLSRALELRPRFPAALTERGLAYVNSGDPAKGRAEYDAAIALDPSYPLAYVNKGAACLLMEDWAEAIPCLDLALRLNPADAQSRYHRGIAHEMLEDFARAARDFRASLESDPTGPLAPHARERLQGIEERAAELPDPEEPAPESLWTRLVALSLEDTVGDLVRKVHAEGAFFGMVTLPEGGRTLAAIYGKDGLRRRLTEIADVIGPRVLELKLGQLHALLPAPAEEASSEEASSEEPAPAPVNPDEGERLVEGRTLHLLTHGERILGVFSGRIDYHDPDLPTVLFGEQPIFGRTAPSAVARRCSSCRRDVAYFDANLEDGKLAGYACPHCAASPVDAWIEERMRPGRWSRAGFLGESEVLREVMERDDRTLERLGLSHAQLADALDRLLAGALRASSDRIVRATRQFEEELQSSGQRGVPGLAVLPLGASLDDLESLLQQGETLPKGRGITLEEHDVFLQVYLGYQHCPFTSLRLPWSDEPPRMEIIRWRERGFVHHTAATDSELPCRPDLSLSYRYGNLEFLIVRRATREALRGSGLLVHLIRDHRFFEGERSPFRLDPERAARVLGLSR